MTMITAKGKVLSMLALSLLLLASSIAIANASQTRTPFYLKAIGTFASFEWSHQADDSLVIMRIIEGGILNNTEGQTVGTWTIDVIESISIKSGKGTASGHFVMNFYSDATIEGTLTAKIQMDIGTTNPPDVDGKFVGHGDMHVIGGLYLVVEGANAILVFDGYSW